MVVGLPRSGTTWAANWLSYAGQICAHDPLWHTHYEDWNKTYDAVSCTGIHDWPEFIMAQACPVLVLHRPIELVRASLARFDTAAQGVWLADDAAERLHDIEGPNIYHCDWGDLFYDDKAAKLWRFMEMPALFDVRRHSELVRIRMEPRDKTPYDASSILHARLFAELRGRRLRANALLGG
jgi:hypothetical protein